MAVRAGAGLVLLFVLLAAVLAAQTISNHNLSGKYYFCELLFSTDAQKTSRISAVSRAASISMALAIFRSTASNP